MSWVAMNALANEVATRGHHAAQFTFRLMHAGYLRGSEVIQLCVQDFAFPGDLRLRQWENSHIAGVRLRHTKTGPEQFVEISDLYLLHSFPHFVAERRRSVDLEGTLFSYSYATLRSLFNEALC